MKYTDKRGDLVVFMKNKKIGQVYFVTFNKTGTVRGQHYHKEWKEWVGIISGRIEVKLQNILTGKKERIILDSCLERYRKIELGCCIAHSFKSLTPYAALICYAKTIWDSNDDYEYKII